MKPSDKQFIVEELMKNSEQEISRLDESVSSKFDGSIATQHALLKNRRTEMSSALDFISQHGSRKNRKYGGAVQRLSMMDESTSSVVSAAESVEQGGGGIGLNSSANSSGIGEDVHGLDRDGGEETWLSYLGSAAGVFQDAVDDTTKSGRGNLHVVFCGDGMYTYLTIQFNTFYILIHISLLYYIMN
jgi:hypothetical protein